MIINKQTTQVTAATLVDATIIFTAAEIATLRGLIARLPVGDPAIVILQGLPTDQTATAAITATTVG